LIDLRSEEERELERKKRILDSRIESMTKLGGKRVKKIFFPRVDRARIEDEEKEVFVFVPNDLVINIFEITDRMTLKLASIINFRQVEEIVFY
jgi:hypothetical protein